jgi:hypothetical protein
LKANGEAYRCHCFDVEKTALFLPSSVIRPTPSALWRVLCMLRGTSNDIEGTYLRNERQENDIRSFLQLNIINMIGRTPDTSRP